MLGSLLSLSVPDWIELERAESMMIQVDIGRMFGLVASQPEWSSSTGKSRVRQFSQKYESMGMIVISILVDANAMLRAEPCFTYSWGALSPWLFGLPYC